MNNRVTNHVKNRQFTLADIRNAISAGVISEESFTRLEAFLIAQSHEAPETEKFTLFRGMNDIFIALGVVALSIGWFILWGMLTESPAFWVAPILAIAGYVALAEYIAGKLKATLPSIAIMASLGATIMLYALALFMPFYSSGTGLSTLESIIEFGQESANIAVLVMVIGFAFQVGFFLRYRLPVSFALIAAGILGVAWAALTAIIGPAIADYLNYLITATGLLLLALGVFVDSRDPQRINGWAECAFWLYVMGAPMTIHSVAVAFEASAWVMVPVIVIAMLFSLVVDRRSPIISSLIYVGYLLQSGFEGVSIDPSVTIVLVCFIIGGLVMAFGVGWQKARHVLLAPFEDQPWRRYLPPS
ncbi:hypothetical protein TH19_07615 [Thalassospira profundimaris]|uniref:DUF2157 domain-containing protein n=1 Tax=Thalassospira profundimaris TaxID=502049 RepID=A0A367W8V9_9PROT|nr:hypothetical protein TH19_07615 [Thalassospira profundimaris]